MADIFDYDYIFSEIDKRLNNGLVPDKDKIMVNNWLKGLKSDIPQMRENNARILTNYLKKGISNNDVDDTNYEMVSQSIFSFLDNNKELSEEIIFELKSYMTLLVNKSISNEEKYKISEKYYDIRRNIKFQEKSNFLLELIEKKYDNNLEYKNRVHYLISILLDKNKPLIERKQAEIAIDDILKYEKELSEIHQKL